MDTEPTKALEIMPAVGERPLHAAPGFVVNTTPEQAKVNAIAELTMTAYRNASTLKLTRDELKALKGDFLDEAFKRGANGNMEMIYIEHAFLRDRLNEVFQAEWAMPVRSRWVEDFEYEHIDSQSKVKTMRTASRVYAEIMLVVRGCYVGEAIGDMTYYKSNQAQNYGDAVEGAKSVALRRCLKEFGVGLQPWKKDFVAAWKTRNPQGTGATPKQAHAEQGKPASKTQAQTERRAAGPGTFDWRNVKVHFGKNKDMLLGDMPEKSLRWYIENFKVETQYEDKATGQMRQCTPQSIDQQKRFRLALNACSEEMGI